MYIIATKIATIWAYIYIYHINIAECFTLEYMYAYQRKWFQYFLVHDKASYGKATSIISKP